MSVIDQNASRFAARAEAVRPLLANLPLRERTVLELRFFKGMTQSQIAAQIGVSQMHVSRILSDTLRYLREQMA
ncbi:Alternative sigma factor SigF [Mycobacteroides abscessus]|nr:Alternative sigma factor SigF [Mycobacteroides abscessus]